MKTPQQLNRWALGYSSSRIKWVVNLCVTTQQLTVLPNCAIWLHSDSSPNKSPRAGLKSSSPPEQCWLWGRNYHNHKTCLFALREGKNPICVPLWADPHSVHLEPAHQPLMRFQSTPTATPVWQVQDCVCSCDFHSDPCLMKLHLWVEFYQHTLKINTCTRFNVNLDKIMLYGAFTILCINSALWFYVAFRHLECDLIYLGCCPSLVQTCHL